MLVGTTSTFRDPSLYPKWSSCQVPLLIICTLTTPSPLKHPTSIGQVLSWRRALPRRWEAWRSHILAELLILELFSRGGRVDSVSVRLPSSLNRRPHG